MLKNKQKKTLLSDNDVSTLSHGTAKSPIKKSRYHLEILLDELRCSSPEERLKGKYYEKSFSHDLKSLHSSFMRSKVPSFSNTFVEWTLQRTISIKRLAACYKADLLMLKIIKPGIDYHSIEFEDLLKECEELHNCMSSTIHDD